MVNSFIGWIGGKKLLRKEILKRFPKEKIGRYIEVFETQHGYYSAKTDIQSAARFSC